MNRVTGRFFIPLALMALSVFTLNVVGVAQDDAEKTEKAEKEEASLYDRLGGVYSIATVVDDFVDRLLANELLNENPMIAEARDRVPKAGLKFRVTALICQLTGGPEVYHGRTMKDAHAHLNINEEQWDAMVADFVTTLNLFKVPEKEQGELLALVGPTKADIVTAKE